MLCSVIIHQHRFDHRRRIDPSLGPRHALRDAAAPLVPSNPPQEDSPCVACGLATGFAHPQKGKLAKSGDTFAGALEHWQLHNWFDPQCSVYAQRTRRRGAEELIYVPDCLSTYTNLARSTPPPPPPHPTLTPHAHPLPLCNDPRVQRPPLGLVTLPLYPLACSTATSWTKGAVLL